MPDIAFRRDMGVLTFCVVASDRRHGDMHPRRTEPHVLGARHVGVAQHRWSMLDQRHGSDVVDVDAQSTWPIAGVGDVVVSRAGRRVGIWAADCAPLLLFGREGTVVGLHAGWRGLAAGVIDVGIEALGAHGDRVACAVLGPVIHPCCYEFGADDMNLVAHGVHASPAGVAGETAWGTPALDVPAAVRHAFASHQLVVDQVGSCTGCDQRWYSHRVRANPERHALVGWVERSDDTDA